MNRKPRILLLGDLMLDEWVHVKPRAANPEGAASIVSGSIGDRGSSLGGVGIAAVLFKQLHTSVKLMSQLSKNVPGSVAHALLHRDKISCKHVHFSSEWSVPLKRRYVNDTGLVIFRYDEESPVDDMLADSVDAFDRQQCGTLMAKADIAAVFDYDKGYLNGHGAYIVQQAFNAGTPLIVGAKPIRLREYVGADVVKLNASEAAQFLDADYNDVLDNLSKAAESLCHSAQARAAVITAGARGSACAVMTSKRITASFELPAIPCFPAVKNCVGAGDAFLVGLTLDYVLSGGRSGHAPSLAVMSEAIAAANAVAAAYLEGGPDAVSPTVPFLARFDSAVAASAENKIVSLATAARVCQVWRLNQETVVFANGCFDLLHEGHLHLLEHAKQQGDRLIVAINSDDSVRALKGAERPVQDFATRSRLLASLRFVDAVVALEEEDFTGNTALRSMITTLQPDVLVKGSEYAEREIVGWEEMVNRPNPGRVWRCPMLDGRSTTNIIEKVKTNE